MHRYLLIGLAVLTGAGPLIFSVLLNWSGFSYVVVAVMAGSAIGVFYSYRRCRPQLLLVMLALIAVLHAVWGIAQFAIQHDLGMNYLGESRLSASFDGVAKFSSVGVSGRSDTSTTAYLRAYGPYQHANVFGGVLVMGLIATLSLLLRRAPTTFQVQVLLVLVVGVLVSFSRSALLGALLALGIAMIYRRRSSANLGSLIVISLVIPLVLFVPLLLIRVGDPNDKGISARFDGYEAAYTIVSRQPIWRGVGGGNYPATLRSRLVESGVAFEEWQIGPVHSVPLLLAAEWGVLPVVGLALLAWYGIRRWYRTSWFWLLPLAPLILFDHYLATQLAPYLLLVVLLFALACWSRPFHHEG